MQMEIETENYVLAILGAGTMGRGIAQIAAFAGHPVMLYDVVEKHTHDAIEFIGQRLEYSFQKGKITENSKLQVIKNIKPVQELDELQKAKLIVEAVIEDLKTKQEQLANNVTENYKIDESFWRIKSYKPS